ncbi:DUF4351 domain-containing protein [Oceanospirillum sediminis]|uniref:DUF4351 domain-containing protein n=1 Tax=Oceanospirillum sediminis TaxID=2760088 RepID=A0A839IYG4_9GAMM|nr:DUF4351 domain-containing protein [Oceanospirillum sediminis]MBB1489644.1 DUF4351 domain-containing protein [Oceanospirillum sediminis]
MVLPEGWYEASEDQAWMLGGKLNRALDRNHFLYDKRLWVVAFQYQVNRDKLLCRHPEQEDMFTLVQLAWSLTSSEVCQTPPVVEMHGSFQDFLSYEATRQGILNNEPGLLNDAERRGELRGIEIGKQQGIAIGEKRGLAVGERQGQVKVLKRQLCRRFKRTPTEVIARINSASDRQLELWADNILTAQTLEQLLEPDEHKVGAGDLVVGERSVDNKLALFSE